MTTSSNGIILDGTIVPEDHTVASAQSRGLMYGEGVFDTLRLYSSRTLFLDNHIQRLCSGLQALGIAHSGILTVERLTGDIKKLLKSEQLTTKDAIVRIQCCRDGNRGYRSNDEGELHYMISASPCPDPFQPVKLVTVDRRRIPSQSLPSEYKFTNGINYILAAQEAEKKGGDDALMQSIDGVVSETTIANIFWRIGRKVFSPSTECDLLPGITRSIMLDLVDEYEGLELETGRFQLEHILQADAVWICNSVREFVPVSAINEHRYNTDDELLAEIRHQFEVFRDRHLSPL